MTLDGGSGGSAGPGPSRGGQPATRDDAPYGSIIERFRGTEWDTTPELPIVIWTAVRGGVTYQRLVSTPVYRPPMTRVVPIGIGSMPPGTTSLVILVTADGIPVEATITAHVPADPANGTPAIDGTATYTYTKVGEMHPISTPIL